MVVQAARGTVSTVLPMDWETVETVPRGGASQVTPLKRGVNEKRNLVDGKQRRFSNLLYRGAAELAEVRLVRHGVSAEGTTSRQRPRGPTTSGFESPRTAGAGRI